MNGAVGDENVKNRKQMVSRWVGVGEIQKRGRPGKRGRTLIFICYRATSTVYPHCHPGVIIIISGSKEQPFEWPIFLLAHSIRDSLFFGPLISTTWTISTNKKTLMPRTQPSPDNVRIYVHMSKGNKGKIFTFNGT